MPKENLVGKKGAASYFHIHISSQIQQNDMSGTLSFFKKFKSLSSHHLSLLFGLSSISWSGHQIHISLPINRLLDSGIDPVLIPSPQHLLFQDLIERLIPGFSISPLVNFSCLSSSSSFGKLLNSSTPSIFLAQVTAHHFYMGIVFITSSLIACFGVTLRCAKWTNSRTHSWHAQLSINLAITASLSIAFAHHIYAIPIYPYCASDYPTVLCLFYHHMWIGALFTIGAGAMGVIAVASKQAATATAELAISLAAASAAAIPFVGWAIAPVAAAATGASITAASAGVEFRENGGTVIAGKPYIVGEKRPELFIPSTNGTILPNTNALNGGGNTGNVTHNITVQVTTMDSKSFTDNINSVMDVIASGIAKGQKRGRYA